MDSNFVFIVHGWRASAQDPHIIDLALAYVKKGDYNSITIDWSSISNESYIAAVEDYKRVGQ